MLFEAAAVQQWPCLWPLVAAVLSVSGGEAKPRSPRHCNMMEGWRRGASEHLGTENGVRGAEPLFQIISDISY